MKASLLKESVLGDYFEWLCDLIEVEQANRSYWILANALHKKEFRWYIPNDDNRASEGVNLREQFCDEHNVPYVFDIFNGPCSMLELLVGLAFRCESIMMDDDNYIPMRDWFWKLIKNVGLDKFPDEVIHDSWEEDKIDIILDKIIDRKYQRNGRGGGLFPLKSSKKDQRKVELWYQLNEYLIENYYSEEEIV